MNFEITGTLSEKFDAVQVSATFKKRQFVIEQHNQGSDGNNYPELISLECIQDKCDLIDKYNIGDKITVLFNVKGRKWISPQGEAKYFNTLQAWQIHSDKSEPEQPKPVAAPQMAPQAAPNPAPMSPNGTTAAVVIPPDDSLEVPF